MEMDTFWGQEYLKQKNLAPHSESLGRHTIKSIYPLCIQDRLHLEKEMILIISKYFQRKIVLNRFGSLLFVC